MPLDAYILDNMRNWLRYGGEFEMHVHSKRFGFVGRQRQGRVQPVDFLPALAEFLRRDVNVSMVVEGGEPVHEMLARKIEKTADILTRVKDSADYRHLHDEEKQALLALPQHLQDVGQLLRNASVDVRPEKQMRHYTGSVVADRVETFRTVYKDVLTGKDMGKPNLRLVGGDGGLAR